MNSTTRTILAALGLLVIGFLAGYTTHREIVKDRLHRVAKERISPGFVERMMEILDITEQQKEEVQPILENYSAKLIEVRKQEMDKRRPILDSMHTNLKEILNADQQEKLNRMVERMKRSKHRRDKKKREPRRQVKQH